MATQTLSPNLDNLTVERKALFQTLDAKAREIERRFRSDWLELASVCETVRDNELWREGEYHSFGDWLKSACPCSRSMAYSAMGIKAELQDIPREDLRLIPLGSAQILCDVPKQHRNGKKLLDAAKSTPPREFISTAIEVAPEAHLAHLLTRKYHFALYPARAL